MDVNAHHSFLVLLIKGVLDGDSAARTLFESADFREMIRQLADRYQRDAQAQLDRPGKHHIEAPTKLDPDDLMRLIVAGKSAAKDALKDIRKWLKGAERIAICDPYIMHPKTAALFKSDDDYIGYINRLLPKSAHSVDFFGNGFTGRIRKALLHEVKEGRQVRFYDTNSIHDRYIIRDRNDGRMLGTSLGGFGNKIFTILDLPATDTKTLVTYLDKLRRKQPANR